jgi:hypothetical protein
MFFKRFYLKKIKIIIISVSVLSVLLIFSIIAHYILGYMGLIYLKNDEGEKVYKFIEDMNGDGKKENVKFVNHYYSYYQKNTFDSEYNSNYIKLYLDGKQIYSNKISSLGPLLNPQISDLVENNTKKRQIYVHEVGGGSAIPMDYFFYIKDGKVIFNRIRSVS